MSIITRIGSSLAGFISSSSSTYILLGIMALGVSYGVYDYKDKIKQIGSLEASIKIANKGTQDAAKIAKDNADKVKNTVEHYEKILQQLQEMEQERRQLEESLREKEGELEKYIDAASPELSQCLKTELPADIFGNLVAPEPSVSSGMPKQ